MVTPCVIPLFRTTVGSSGKDPLTHPASPLKERRMTFTRHPYGEGNVMAVPSTLICITVEQVARKMGVSDVFVWTRAKTDPEFPQPLKLGPMTTRWLENEVDAWILAQREACSTMPKAA